MKHSLFLYYYLLIIVLFLYEQLNLLLLYPVFVCIPKQHLVLFSLILNLYTLFYTVFSFCNLPLLFNILCRDLVILLLVPLLDSFFFMFREGEIERGRERRREGEREKERQGERERVRSADLLFH